MEGIVECDRTLLWWWHSGKPKVSWYYQPTGAGRIQLAEVFGKDHWSHCVFVQFVMTTDDEVDQIRVAEPGVPRIGGMDGPDRPPPQPPQPAAAEDPVPDTPMGSTPASARPRSMRGSSPLSTPMTV